MSEISLYGSAKWQELIDKIAYNQILYGYTLAQQGLSLGDQPNQFIVHGWNLHSLGKVPEASDIERAGKLGGVNHPDPYFRP